MQKRCLGKTNLIVSVIGLGTVKFGRNSGVHYPQTFALPDDKSLAELLALAKDQGINYLDTAPAYGLSEERLGALLGNSRQEWLIATKVGEEFLNGESHHDFSPLAIHKSVERSLKRLKTDYLDLLLIHSNGKDVEIIDGGVFDILDQLKQQGKIRAHGMSTKTVAGGLLAVKHADVLMITYHPAYVAEKEVIVAALKNQTGIIIKKALASGHLDRMNDADPVMASMRFIFSTPGISSVVIGTINPIHLRENVSKALANIS